MEHDNIGFDMYSYDLQGQMIRSNCKHDWVIYLAIYFFLKGDKFDTLKAKPSKVKSHSTRGSMQLHKLCGAFISYKQKPVEWVKIMCDRELQRSRSKFKGTLITRSVTKMVCHSVLIFHLLIIKAYVSYGSSHLKRLWSCSIDFLIFWEFLTSNISMRCNNSQAFTPINQ